MATMSTTSKYPAKEHARRVAKTLKADSGLIYLQAPRTGDYNDSRDFSQDRFFYYLSGCNEPDFHITYDISTDQLNLYLPNYGISHIYFYGTKNTIQDSLQRYDIDGAAYIADLPDYLSTWSTKSPANIYLLNTHASYIPQVHAVLASLPPSRLDTTLLEPATTSCRLLKDAYEITQIRTANQISAKAHTAILRNLKSYTSERDLEAQFIATSISNRAKRQAYAVIAAAGSNAATLHYSDDNANLLPEDNSITNQLVVLDAGAEYANYASDVTRSFPLMGHWPSAECKAIYHLVQRMQDAAVACLGPGNDAKDTSLAAQKEGIRGLLDLGIFRPLNKRNNTIHTRSVVEDILELGTLRAFFPHGLGHHLGLDVHDVVPDDMQVGCCAASDAVLPGRRAQTLGLEKTQGVTTDADVTGHRPVYKHATYAPGMVLTIEPGLYFNRYVLDKIYRPDARHAAVIDFEVVERYLHVGGVRIEDDYLVTETGWENLTTAPKGERALRIIRGEED